MDMWKRLMVLVVAVTLAGGCSRPVLRGHAQPSRTKDQYLRIKRVAIFPFENYTEAKDADKVIDALLPAAIRDEEVFDEVEDTRFVRDVMKKLKITSTDILDKEVVRKLGEEMNVQGIIYGKVVTFGKGKEKEAAPEVTMDLAVLDPGTGNVLWVGNVTSYGGLTMGKIFGVTGGKTDVEVAREAVRKLASSLASDIEDAREKESKGIVAELRKEGEKEQARLNELKERSGKIQEQLDAASRQAEELKAQAAKEAEAVRSDLELREAAIEAEKAKADAAQQEAAQDKLQAEMERRKVEEELKKIEEARKKLEEERRAAEEAVRKAEQAIKEEPVGDPPSSEPAPAPAAEGTQAPPEGAPPAPPPGAPQGQ